MAEDHRSGTPRWGRARRLRRALASVRVRVVVGYLVLLAAGLIVAVLVTRQVQLARVDREIEREMAQEVDELRLLAAEGIDPSTGDPFGDDARRIFDTFLQRNVPAADEAFYTIVDGEGYLRSFGAPDLFQVSELMASWSTASHPVRVDALTEAGEVRSLAVPLVGTDERADVFVVVFFPDDDQGEVAQVVRVISLAGLAVLIVTAALAWSLAGRVLRPVRELSDAARSITESDLSARIPVVGHDELAELGTTFNEMVDRLERGIRAQRDFLDDVAHELRTPITIARGHLEVLGDDPAERAETIEIVTDELDRMSRYVSDLLLLAKAEHTDFLELRPVDVGELANDLLARVPALGERRWVLDGAPPVGVFATMADPERLGQAVLNLAANAVQHTEAGDEIGLGTAVDEGAGQVRLWVRDTGSGVDPHLADSLFHRYSRAAASRSRRPDGTGIGLSIVDAIARSHGGWAAVDTVPGSGATFTLVIPVVTTAPPTTPLSAPTWAPPSPVRPLPTDSRSST